MYLCITSGVPTCCRNPWSGGHSESLSSSASSQTYHVIPPSHYVQVGWISYKCQQLFWFAPVRKVQILTYWFCCLYVPAMFTWNVTTEYYNSDWFLDGSLLGGGWDMEGTVSTRSSAPAAWHGNRRDADWSLPSTKDSTPTASSIRIRPGKWVKNEITSNTALLVSGDLKAVAAHTAALITWWCTVFDL